MCPQVEGIVSLEWVDCSPVTEATVNQEEVLRMMCILVQTPGTCLIQICTYVCNNTFRGLHNCTNISQLLRNFHNNESADSALHSIMHHYCVIPATTAHRHVYTLCCTVEFVHTVWYVQVSTIHLCGVVLQCD